MSEWNGGHGQVGESVSSKVKAIATITQASRNSAGSAFEIAVATGPLHLGALRQTFASKIHMEVAVWDILHDGTSANNVDADDIINKVQALIAKQAGLDKEDVKVEPQKGEAADIATAKKSNNPLHLKTDVYVHDESASGLTVAEWQQKLLPAGYQAQQYFKQAYPAATASADYRFLVGINEVSNSVETIDLDLVVHGIEYSDLSAQRQRAFLSAFAAAVRTGLVNSHDAAGHLASVADQIEVVVSDPGVKGAVNVRAKIPAPKPTAAVKHPEAVLLQFLDGQLNKKQIQTDVKTELQGVSGLSFVTTWTPEAIHVSQPGQIDDFAGDLAVKADQQ